MRVLVTGGTGFLGAHVCRQLLEKGHSVTLCVRETSHLDRLTRLTGGRPQQPVITRYDDLVPSAGYDAVIHMATAYGRGGDAASELIASNIQMPVRMLEQCLKNGVGLFVNTDSYYSASGPNHPMTGYILSKRHFVEWARAIAGTRLKLVNMRIEHLYGPMDAPGKFCTAIVRDCLANKPRIALTAGDQLRDFIFVEDAAAAYATLLEHAVDCVPGWNEIGVGCGHAVPLREFVTKAHALTGSQSTLGFGDLAKAGGEIAASKADNSFLTARGWRCVTSLDEGIRALVEDAQQETGHVPGREGPQR
jgi:nucleoside-diphosphate-sugar epimerase